MPGPLDPQAINFRDGSTACIWRAASWAFIPYSVAVMCPICHGPSISLPRHQYSTLYDCSVPWLRRRSLHFVPFSMLQYSTRAAARSAVPVPRFRPIRGRAPTILLHAINSLVPNWLVSMVFHALSSTRGRSFFGPTPSSQLYPDTKLPPG